MELKVRWFIRKEEGSCLTSVKPLVGLHLMSAFDSLFLLSFKVYYGFSTNDVRLELVLLKQTEIIYIFAHKLNAGLCFSVNKAELKVVFLYIVLDI